MLKDELEFKGSKARDTEIVIKTFGIDKTKSCVSFAKASSVKSGSSPFAHNDRSENEKNYIIGSDDKQRNEFDKRALDAEKFYKELRAEAEINYRKKVGQKMQIKKGNDHWEAVINLKRNHTIADVQKVAQYLEKETGFTAVQISVHKDEGHFMIDGKKHSPSETIHKDKKGKWFFDRAFKKPVDMTKAKKIYNNHAHINFFTLQRKTGIQLYHRYGRYNKRTKVLTSKGMTKKVLSEIQTKTAEILGMERGKIGSKAVRLAPRQYRAVEAEKETEKQRYKEQIKTLGNEYKTLENKYNETREVFKKSGIATQKDYKELKKKHKHDCQELKQKYEHSKAEVDTDKPKKKALSIKELKKCKELGMNEQEITTFSTLKRDTEKQRNLANATRMKTEHSKITNPHLNTAKHLELLLSKEGKEEKEQQKQQQSKLRELQLELKQQKKKLERYLKPNSTSLKLAKRRIKTKSKPTRGRM
jgi:hypothetical protein